MGKYEKRSKQLLVPNRVPNVFLTCSKLEHVLEHVGTPKNIFGIQKWVIGTRQIFWNTLEHVLEQVGTRWNTWIDYHFFNMI